MTTFELNKMDDEEKKELRKFIDEIVNESSRILVGFDHYGQFSTPTKKNPFYRLGEVQVSSDAFKGLYEFVQEKYQMVTIIYKKKS